MPEYWGKIVYDFSLSVKLLESVVLFGRMFEVVDVGYRLHHLVFIDFSVVGLWVLNHPDRVVPLQDLAMPVLRQEILLIRSDRCQKRIRRVW